MSSSGSPRESAYKGSQPTQSQEGASEGDQTPTGGRRAERQEHAGSSSTAAELFNEASLARVCSAALSGSDAEWCSKSVTEISSGNDAETDSDAAALPCRSSAGSPSLDKGCPELKQSQAPHVHGPNKQATAPRATGDPSHSDSSLLESTRRSEGECSPSLESCKEQHLRPEEPSSTESMPFRTPSDADSGHQLEAAQHGQTAQRGQHLGKLASFAEGNGAQQECSAAGSTFSQSGQTHDARQIAFEHLLQESIPQGSQEFSTGFSGSGCSPAVPNTHQEHTSSFKQPIRDPGQKQMTEQSNKEGKRADSIRQQQRQIAVPLDLAIAVCMVVGLTAVLVCGLAMLASTYMSTTL